MIAAKPIHASVEEAHQSGPALQAFAPPGALITSASCERLVAPLRDAARTRDPLEILTRAALAFHAGRRAEAPHAASGNAMATALADLAVTGRAAFARFRETLPDESTLVPALVSRLVGRGVAVPVEHAVSAAGEALDRAYRVAGVLRGTPEHGSEARPSLGWIAVSAEDDPPHRPVNVPSAPYPQHSLNVRVRDTVIETRFFVATRSPTREGHAPSARTLPLDSLPEIPDDHRVVLFLHGHSSRAEEALDLVAPLLAAGHARGRPFAVVSLDLPCNGYSSMLDHTEIAASDGTTFPAGVFDRGPVQTPVLDFLEDFVVAFVDALDEVVPIKHRFAGIIGGSLGGNLGLRLGRRDLSAHPWLRSGIVSWAPGSVWAPMVEDAIKRRAPEHCREKWNEPEESGCRAEYFAEVFDQVIIPLFIPHTQPSMWYRSGWEPHKAARIRLSRRDRYEIYNPLFRRWHWRVAGEQLIYSHIDRVDRQSPTSPLRHSLNRVRHLLAAGVEDDYPGSNIYSATRHLAERMTHTPGRSIFLLGTGHSIHAERPRYLAGEIASFLTEEADAAG